MKRQKISGTRQELAKIEQRIWNLEIKTTFGALEMCSIRDRILQERLRELINAFPYQLQQSSRSEQDLPRCASPGSDCDHSLASVTTPPLPKPKAKAKPS